MKQIELSPGINLILDGFVIVPPSQWYQWHNYRSFKNLPFLPIDVVNKIY